MRSGFIALLLAASSVRVVTAQDRLHHLMPVPAVVEWGAGSLRVDGAFRAGTAGATNARLERALGRFVQRLARQTGIPVGVGHPADRPVTLTVAVVDSAGAFPRLGD